MKTTTISLLPLLLVLLHRTLTADCLYANSKTPVTRHYNNAVNRFPHLQRVADRIESVSRHHHHPTPPPPPVPYYPHHFARASTPPVTDLATLAPKHLRPASAAEHQPKRYSHDYDDEDDDEDEDEEEEDEDEDEDEGDGDRAKDLRNAQTLPHGRSPWVSRVSTTTPRSSRPVLDPKPTMSSYSNFKWDILGRQKSLDEFRNSRLNLSKETAENAEENKLAGQHAVRASRETICKVPRPKVIHVKDVHPHPSKSYVPHCIVLHQCGTDTGCCYGDTHTCVARVQQQVVLYFHTTLDFGAFPTSSGGRRYPQSTGHSVEKLVFHNHTECSCQNKLDVTMPRDMDAVSSSKHHLQLSAASPAYQRPQQQRQYHRPQETPPSSRSFSSKSCRCPVEFASRLLDDEVCSCECFDKQRDCLRLKEGKDYFTHGDKLCIEKGHCHPPSCEYGVYNRMAGRCPRRQDQTSTWSHHPSTTRHNNF